MYMLLITGQSVWSCFRWGERKDGPEFAPPPSVTSTPHRQIQAGLWVHREDSWHRRLALVPRMDTACAHSVSHDLCPCREEGYSSHYHCLGHGIFSKCRHRRSRAKSNTKSCPFPTERTKLPDFWLLTSLLLTTGIYPPISSIRCLNVFHLCPQGNSVFAGVVYSVHKPTRICTNYSSVL